MTTSREQVVKEAKKALEVFPAPRHFVRDRRWEDYVDLLPGFENLDPETAYTIYRDTIGIAYRPAKKNFKENGKFGDGREIPGVGFIEVMMANNEGALLLSTELRRAYIYRKAAGDFEKLNAVAEILGFSAGWWVSGEDAETAWEFWEDDEQISYYQQGAAIEEEHRRALKAASVMMLDARERLYFVEDLRVYYDGMRAITHRAEWVQASNIKDEEALRRATALQAQCESISDELQALSRRGVYKIKGVKADPSSYKEVYQKLRAMREALLPEASLPPVGSGGNGKIKTDEPPLFGYGKIPSSIQQKAQPTRIPLPMSSLFRGPRRPGDVRGQWALAAGMLKWTKRIVSFGVGAGVGYGVRTVATHGLQIGAKFAIAAFVTTTPISALPLGVTLGVAMVSGALAGGASRWAVTLIGDKDKKEGWASQAFLRGALMGAVGGFVGAGLVDFFSADGYLHDKIYGRVANLLKGHSVDVSTMAQATTLSNEFLPQEIAPLTATSVTAQASFGTDFYDQTTATLQKTTRSIKEFLEKAAAAQQTEAINIDPSIPMAAADPSHVGITTASLVQPPIQAVAPELHVASVASTAATAEFAPQTPAVEMGPPAELAGVAVGSPVPESFSGILSAEQFQSLSPELQKMAGSGKPGVLLHFCKEASFKAHLENSPAASKLEYLLLQRGAEIAKDSGLHNATVEQIHADLGYCYAYGRGVTPDLSEAADHLERAGKFAKRVVGDDPYLRERILLGVGKKDVLNLG